MKARVLIAVGLGVPLAVVTALAILFALGAAATAHVPDYVVRIALPSGTRQIGLPPIEGPADASRPLVVIDAGHGGHDPGASGLLGEKEKTITLALARALRKALLEQGRVRVALTRDDDHFLALDERSGIARRLKADLFVSVHADAAESPDATGATVYTLSDRGSDAVADAVARRENRADTVNGVTLSGQSDAVTAILVSLSQREMRERSRAFGALVLREGEGRLRFHTDPEREAAFVVLKSLDLPSALIEAGYISSPDDARAMGNPDWREKFAGSVASAIGIYLARTSVVSAVP
ncbi:N-acetylmuramoyl-L-alanine amidase [Novosphingobium sp. PASSN1]|uniref:N-acetylmuramoyl-L-alanine amidase family protein n=1 Tax=Novosphingobium sp. PASSN1 TaxID=2015561 RepID=UPI000BD7D72C|nr:N-acetylmuramoyl-L-alanine amidase [Novosphingobium sp. PASSN1]OYU35854.1 MAG: N-acetylmuramoyl-L-alanine amidase [Novosphingobium sp. PASSN1]